MSILCMFGMAIGHFGCLMLHFGTISGIWYHFATFRDCFSPYFVAEILLVCLHIIFAMLHCMSILCMFSIAIGHFGCLNSHFGTIPYISCHFASFRDCFPPYFSAEIPLVGLHIIFATFHHILASPRFACPCARISRHSIFLSDGILCECG